MTGRGTCPLCGAQTVTAATSTRAVTLDWPWTPNGIWAVEHTASGRFSARYVPVGVATTVTEKRYREHACQDTPQQEQRAAWQAADSAHKAASRNKRGKRPQPAITGIRINPKGTSR